MSSLNINYSALKYDCINNLQDIIKELDRALEILKYTNIPYNYNKKSLILTIRNNLLSERNKIFNIQNWIEESCKGYDRLIKVLSDRALKIPKYKIERRKEL